MKLLYSKHILTNCLFLIVFPTRVDPFEPSVNFFHTFEVFSAIEVLLYWAFRVYEKDFFFAFLQDFLGPVGSHVLIVGPVA